MPLGDQKILVASRPIFVSVFARIFLKEPCGTFELLNMCLMLAGVVCVMKPPVIFGDVMENSAQYDDESLMASILVFVATIFAANNSVIIRRMRKDHVASLTATHSMIFIMFSFFIVFTTGRQLNTPSYEDQLIVLGVAAGNFTTTVLNTLALKLEEANQVSLVDKSGSIIMAFLLQMIYFGNVPGMLTWVGAGLVGLAVILCGIKKIVVKHLAQ